MAALINSSEQRVYTDRDPGLSLSNTGAPENNLVVGRKEMSRALSINSDPVTGMEARLWVSNILILHFLYITQGCLVQTVHRPHSEKHH